MDQKTLTVIITLLICATIHAQDSTSVAEHAEKNNSVDELDTIIVTGEGVSRSLFDTNTSVEVIRDEQLKQLRGRNNIKEVITNAANVYSSSSVGAPIIRGQDTQGPNYGAGAFFGGTVPRVGINVDGRISTYNELYFGSQSTWDVEQIEVLRGPQTTTQGANSIAGAIIVNTKDPTFTPEFAGELSYGSRNKKTLGAVVSGPIVADELAGRIAFSYSGRDTFVDFTNPNFRLGEAKKGIENKNIRAKLLWTPSANLDAKFTISHSESEGPQQEIVNAPFAERNNVATSLVSWPIDSTAVIADVHYDIDDNHYLTTQWQWSDSDVRRAITPANFGSAEIEKRDISNESKYHFASKDERFSGFVGFYLRKTTSDELLNLRGKTIFDDEKKQLGLFGELTYKLDDKWSLTSSVRYQRDEIKRHGSSVLAPGAALDYQETFHEVLPKVALSYHFNDDVVVGASVGKGYNPGGVGLSFRQRKFVTFDKETVWNYELFTRANLLDDRLAVDANLFYSDFKNAQRNVVTTVPGSADLVEALSINAEKAKSYGMELGLRWDVTDTFNLNGSLGLLHTKIGRFSDANENYTGKKFAKSPSHTLQLGADWQFSPDWSVGGTVRHVGSYYSDDINKDDFHIDNFTTVNARLSYQPSDTVEIFAYANNLFDEDSPTWVRKDARGNGFMANVVEPREFGIGLRASW